MSHAIASPVRAAGTLTLPPRAVATVVAAATEPDAPAAPPLPSERLLQGRRAVEISHNGAVYRLQATKLGKLILTK